MRTVAIFIAALLLMGCELWPRPTEFTAYGKTDLVAVAEQVEPQLEAAFDTRLPYSVSFEYGQWSEIRGLDITIMGKDGLFVPHSNSPLGFRYKALRKKLAAAPGIWSDDPVLVAEWEEYWTALRAGLDRRNRMWRRRR